MPTWKWQRGCGSGSSSGSGNVALLRMIKKLTARIVGNSSASLTLAAIGHAHGEPALPSALEIPLKLPPLASGM